MKTLLLAWHMLRRDLRSGELTILMLALIIAVSSSTAITLFGDRLQATLNRQAAEFLAADLVIVSPEVLPNEWLQQAESLQLNSSRTVEFSSVLIENDEMLLAGVKAVDGHYPLRGHIKTLGGDGYDNEQTGYSGPEAGSAWLEPRIFSALKLTIGSTITVGAKQLTVTRILSYEPDKRGDIYSLSPRVMINAADLTATGVIQPGSQVRYFFQFSGEAAAVSAFNHWLKPKLNASQRLMDIHEDRPELGNAVDRAERYLGLSGTVVIVIAGVAIAMTARRYTERHFNGAALLRCLGSSQRQVLQLFGYQLTLIGLIGSSIGCGIGWFAQTWLFDLLKDLLPSAVAAPSPFSVLFGLIAGLMILGSFALPPLLRIRNVAPLRILRRDLEPLQVSGWLVYGLALALIAALIRRYSGDIGMTCTLLGGGLAISIGLGIIVNLLLSQSRKLLPMLPLPLRFALQSLTRNIAQTRSQILAFAVTLAAMLLSLSVHNDLLADWRQHLPYNAPNHFALNIFTDQIDSFRNQLQRQRIQCAAMFPVVRGRLIKINDMPVQQLISKESQGERAIQRDLSLTWSDSVPQDNRIVAGQWWQDATTGLVSIEQKLAENLKVKIGDNLTFTLGSEPLTARVASIRQVQWDTMQPNFYMIFSPGTLAGFANTHITSFYLPPEQKNLLNALIKQHPNVTLLEVDTMLKQFQTILAQLTAAIDILLYCALAAGFTVLFAALYASLDERLYQGALMRTLGAGSRLLRRTHAWEFALLGLLSALLGLLLAESVTFALYHFVLHMNYRPNLTRCLLVLTSGSLFIGLAGYLGVGSVIKQSPMRMLRNL